MFLSLNHKNLQVYQTSREFIKECYAVTKLLPFDEKYNLTQQIRRAALSVKLNLAEGSSRRSENERRRYYEISRGSVIEIDAALETIFDLEYLKMDELQPAGDIMIKIFKMLSNMIK